MDGQHIPVDWIHIGQNSYDHKRLSQMETTCFWYGQASERGGQLIDWDWRLGHLAFRVHLFSCVFLSSIFSFY